MTREECVNAMMAAIMQAFYRRGGTTRAAAEAALAAAEPWIVQREQEAFCRGVEKETAVTLGEEDAS